MIKSLLFTSLLIATACRDSAEPPPPEYPAAKPVEKAPIDKANDDFIQARAEYKARAKVRLNQIEVDLRKLGDRTDAEAREAAARLRVKRDQLAARIERAEEYTKANWEQFENEMSRNFDELEISIKAALR